MSAMNGWTRGRETNARPLRSRQLRLAERISGKGVVGGGKHTAGDTGGGASGVHLPSGHEAGASGVRKDDDGEREGTLDGNGANTK